MELQSRQADQHGLSSLALLLICSLCSCVWPHQHVSLVVVRSPVIICVSGPCGFMEGQPGHYGVCPHP